MKKIVVLFMSITLSLNSVAQGGFGGGGRGGSGFGGGQGGSPRGGFGGGGRMGGMQDVEETIVIEFFPEISNLSNKQKKDIEKILTNEQKSVRTMQRQKRALFRKDKTQPPRRNDINQLMDRELFPNDMDFSENPEEHADASLTPKQLEKARQKAAKIDEKIRSLINKSNKKIAKKLNPEQYASFLAKRSEFKFSVKRPNMIRPPEDRSPSGRSGGIGPPEN